MPSAPKIGIVIPTLGRRHDLLDLCIKSVREAGIVHLSVVAPQDAVVQSLLERGIIDQYELDPGVGLASAINHGLNSLPDEIEYANWLGDDDLLEPRTLEQISAIFDNHPRTVLVFGKCSYIDSRGLKLFSNRSGRWAVPLMRFGPQLVSQPGSLFKLETFRTMGGLNTKYNWAFDLDFFLRLTQEGKLTYIATDVSSFRWHPGSLSVGGRKSSVREASQIRKMYLPRAVRGLSELWEAPMRWFILKAGTRISSIAVIDIVK